MNIKCLLLIFVCFMIRGSNLPLSITDAKLLKACAHNDSKGVEEALDKNACIDIKDTNGLTPLMLAAHKGHSNIVLFLLENKADTNARTSEGATALHFAVESGEKFCVDFLISYNSDVNAQNKSGATPLMTACQLDQREIAEVLVEYCDVNIPMNASITPLFFSCIGKKLWWVEFLLENGANQTTISRHGYTPLSFACNCYHIHIAQILIDHKGDLTQVDAKKKNLVLQLMNQKELGRYSTIDFLLSKGVPCDIPDDQGCTALHCAALDGDVLLVDVFLKRGARSDRRNGRGDTPLVLAAENCHYYSVMRLLLTPGSKEKSQLNAALIRACAKGYKRIAEALFNHGAEVNGENEAGITPLMAACFNNEFNVASWLIDQKNASLYHVNKKGNQPHHFVCVHDKYKAVQFLVEQGADIDSVSFEHGPALSIACKQGNKKLVEYLLKMCATVDVPDHKGKTALMFACQKNMREIAQILLKKNADPNFIDTIGETPLTIASRFGALECATLLVEYKANPSAITFDDLTPLLLASCFGHSKIVDLLIAHGVPVDQQGPAGITPLLLACQTGRLKVVKKLIKHNASLNVQTHDGLIPIMCAHAYGAQHVVDYLKELGAELKIEGIYSLIPLLLTKSVRELDNQIVKSSCAYCHEGNASFFCQQCNKTRYCDKICLDEHTTVHKEECMIST